MAEPIVLGATNRFIYDAMARFPTARPVLPSEVGPGMLTTLVTTIHSLTRRTHVIREVDSDMRQIGSSGIPGTERVEFEDVSLDGTYIEVYNSVRNFQGDHNSSEDESRNGPSWPFFPEVCRALEKLGATRWERWKGRVRILNREDIPDCPACGYSGHRPVGVDPFHDPGHHGVSGRIWA
jgi:hypothetical protein